jgi:hypothetical protein
MKTLIVITLALLVSCKKNPFDPNEPGDGADSTAKIIKVDTLKVK